MSTRHPYFAAWQWSSSVAGRRRIALFAALSLLSSVTLYEAAYFKSVRPRYKRIYNSAGICGCEVVPLYSNPFPIPYVLWQYAPPFFEPAHKFDRRIRHEVWHPKTPPQWMQPTHVSGSTTLIRKSDENGTF